MNCKSFEITVPVLNEEKEIVQKIEILITFLSNSYPEAPSWSIVIADNGSTDDTRCLAEGLVGKYKGLVKYVRLDKPGVGGGLKASWGQSTAEIVGYLDLDLATDLRHLPEALSLLIKRDCDIVYGTRLHKDSVVLGRCLKREIVSRCFNLILKLYLNTKFSDGMCGFKFLRREILEQLLNNGAVSNGWFFSTELLVVGERLNYRLYGLPVRWTDSSDSRVRILPLAIQYLKGMHALKKRRSERNGQ